MSIGRRRQNAARSVEPGVAGDIAVYLCRDPVDFRAGINGLSVLVEQTLKYDPFLCVGRDYVSEAAEGHVLTARAWVPPPHNISCLLHRRGISPRRNARGAQCSSFIFRIAGY
jgi:hypothetical protein